MSWRQLVDSLRLGVSADDVRSDEETSVRKTDDLLLMPSTKRVSFTDADSLWENSAWTETTPLQPAEISKKPDGFKNTEMRVAERQNGVLVAFSFCGLVCDTVAILLCKKLSQVDGRYDYNPASALAMATFGQLCIASGLHCCSRGATPLFPDVPFVLPFTAVLLGLAYSINNQLVFTILTVANLSTFGLYKASTPMLVAVGMWLFFGDNINKLQWATMLLQVSGLFLVSTAINADEGSNGSVAKYAAPLLATSMCVTASTSVLFSRALKNFEVPIPVFTFFMYLSSLLFNLTFYLLRLTSTMQTQFFAGYKHNLWAVGVVVTNCLAGVSFSTLSKYGDAIIARYASSVAAAVLCVLEVPLFGLHVTLYSVMGALVVLVSSFIYFDIAISMPAPAWPFQFAGALAVAQSYSIDKLATTLVGGRSSASSPATMLATDATLPSSKAQPSRSTTIAFFPALCNALALVSTVCGTAFTVCRLVGHRTLLTNAIARAH